MLRRLLAVSIVAVVHILASAVPIRRAKTLAMVKGWIRPKVVIDTKHGSLAFSPNSRKSSQMLGLSLREPDTLEFIDAIPGDAVLWDIGANVGLYSTYAALRGVAAVVAFEPHAQNFSALNRHIEINRMQDRVTAYPVAFARETKLATLNMRSASEGADNNQFDADQAAWCGPIQVNFRQGSVGFSVDDFARLFSPPLPNFVKIDVDGLEAAILHGGRKVFSSPSVRGMIVEVLDDLDAVARDEIMDAMRDLGFAPQPRKSPALRNTIFSRA